MSSEVVKYFSVIGVATWQTFVMVLFSTVFSLIIGLPLGILLCTSDSATGLRPHKLLNQILSVIINILRAIPFVILVILLFPVTRAIVHTAIGTKASIVPLTIAAAPFVARVIESSLKEVDPGVVQAARSMGSTDRQIIFKVLLPEALPSIVNGITLTIINLIGYSAMAGTVGGGGLGDVAIRYGYQRYRVEYMLGSVAIILILVEVIQLIGTHVANKMQKNR
ncbi:MAG: ABC transporter permease [Treponema sp.]|nr:ABC transporter permease [Treponema sp.]